MTSNIVVTQIPVSRKGQSVFFEVSIPKDATGITGIQSGITGVQGPLQLPGKRMAGSVKLQAVRAADLCYSAQLFLGTGSLEKTLPGLEKAPAALVGLFTFPDTGNTHDSIERLYIPNCYTLYGCYEDTIGRELNRDIAYTVGLYLWTQLDNDKNAGK